MRLKNFLIVVDDVERSKQFYKEVFGLEIMRDFDTNVILAQGLVLQEKGGWEQELGQQVKHGSNEAVLYFEEYDLEAFQRKLEGSEWSIRFLNPCQLLPNGQKMMRLTDPDGHVIEIREMEKF